MFYHPDTGSGPDKPSKYAVVTTHGRSICSLSRVRVNSNSLGRQTSIGGKREGQAPRTESGIHNTVAALTVTAISATASSHIPNTNRAYRIDVEARETG
jgi:hypothetical protein